MTKQRFACLTWFRAFGTILILFCHCVCQSENSFLVASSQLLNIGNSIFFIMSGFIFGFQGAIKQPIYKWYARRFKRIYLPYELMLFVLFIISIICNIPINLKQWILQIIGLQGWNGVYGAAQTWFITSILLCYFFTPLISDITFGTKEKKNSCRKEILILCCIPFLLAYLLDSVVDTEIFMPICWYSISYVVGANYERINIKKQTAIIAFLLMCAGFVLRFCAKLVFDDTIFYNNIVVGFTQTFGAFCLFYIFAAF